MRTLTPLRFTSSLASTALAGLGALALASVPACGATPIEPSSNVATTAEAIEADIGSAGGEIVGKAGSPFAGVRVVVPAGALTTNTHVRIARVAGGQAPLPAAAKACGPTFAIEPAGLALAMPAEVTLPFDQTVVDGTERYADEVKVWVKDGDHWGQQRQVDSSEGSVSIALTTFSAVAAGVNPPADVDVVRFPLVPNPKFLDCLAAYPGDLSRAPRAEVTVVRGEQNDALKLRAYNIKPGLKFDMFTVEHSPLTANGAPDASFTNFGLAWYQSDLDARGDGRAHVNIRTILLDQIFGFDPKVDLAPTVTFHVGFWFNDPNDAAACGFDPTKPTPFNGDHEAGPLAMISVPDAATYLGPLCTKADTSTSPPRCSP